MSRVVVQIDESKANRVFLKFAGADAKKRAERVETAAKLEAPQGKTGALKRGIRTTQARDLLGRWSVGFNVTSNAPYSLYVIKGTRPHRIQARKLGGVLAFLDSDGDMVFTPYVNHPGTKANDFMSRALRRAK